MKLLISILGLLNGAYMLLDGIYVMLKGKYISPEKPGLWANLFYKLNIDVFKLGPLGLSIWGNYFCAHVVASFIQNKSFNYYYRSVNNEKGRNEIVN